ncbi:DUF7168 domain-containing protein [Desulfomonile tiedjei]|uniref:Uncharacterized protein n=1 Tax=Desulfomonile tiedjei (strain ATCC 49306 / DSM 6799 / DCB-1) TaxID=706587 RepID=I4C3A7_DESTA|nr:DUF2786 domain-containing protein [Desulfomonile tiedjei]AFM24048.1 Protein of unknown function (DUF2786) [Desulfomonile tiedjei DSM 6799]
MTKEEVLSKVRKLFELSHSPNENEAALAAAKARELLARYNLGMADLSTEEISNNLNVKEQSITVGKVLRNWMKGLLIHVSQGFECEHVIRRRQGAAPVLTFIGTGTDTEVALYTFRFLYRELNRLVERALPELKRVSRGWSAASLRFAYLDGAVKRIGERFEKQTAGIRAAERNGCKELVLAKEQIIHDYMRTTFSHLRNEYSRRRTVSSYAFSKGYGDAGNIRLNRAVGDEESRQSVIGA